MSREKQETWANQQRILDLEHDRDGLATQNAKLREERDAATRAGYTSQEAETTLNNRLAAKEGEVKELKGVLQPVQDRMEEIETNAGTTQAEAIAKERELLRVRTEISMFRGSRDVAIESADLLSGENASLREQVTALSGIREERDELQEQNRYLVGRNKLLKSQVGNYMVDSGRIGIYYYVFHAMSNVPIIGSFIRQASQEVYDTHIKKP